MIWQQIAVKNWWDLAGFPKSTRGMGAKNSNDLKHSALNASGKAGVLCNRNFPPKISGFFRGLLEGSCGTMSNLYAKNHFKRPQRSRHEIWALHQGFTR
jgi:hypothetical protein